MANKKEIQNKIKQKMSSRTNKKPGRKPKTKSTKDWSIYENLKEEEKLKFWDSKTGYLLFKEITGESFYPQFIIDKAFDMFLDGLTIEDISVKWNIPVGTIENWSSKQNWTKKVEKIFDTIESKMAKEKSDALLSERKEIDKRHRQIVKGLQGEIARTISQKFDHIKDIRLRKTEEQSQLNRMKVLKMASDCYSNMIKLEREIVGIENISNERELPQGFDFTIRVGHDVIDQDDIDLYLPDQNPHEFTPDAIENNEIITPQIPESSSDAIKVNFQKDESLDPIMIAKNRGLNPPPPPPPVNNYPEPHPFLGYVDI